MISVAVSLEELVSVLIFSLFLHEHILEVPKVERES